MILDLHHLIHYQEDRGKKVLRHLVKPTPSALFLFWQIISRSSLNLLSQEDRQVIQDLALTSQSNEVTARLWMAD